MWKFEFSKESKKFLDAANKKLRASVFEKIRNVGEWLDNKDQLTTDIKRLKGEWEGFYRIIRSDQ